MKGTDKFLIGIVAGIILLVGVAFAVALLRPKPAYKPEDTPGGVAHNYLLALKQADYPRAYGYLSPAVSGYPASVEQFTGDVERNRYNFGSGDSSTTLEVGSVRASGDRATVTVQETHFYSGGLFDSNQYTNTFDMTLQRENGAWKVVASNSYWAWCWNDIVGCR